MTLRGGDLTTPQRVANWLASPPSLPSTIISQLIPSMSGLIYGHINRGRVYSRTFTRTFNGLGTSQLVLPDYPVTSVDALSVGLTTIPPSQANSIGSSYGYRVSSWDGDLPGENAVVEFAGGYFPIGAQNINVTYTAGYLVAAEAQTVPATPFKIAVLQEQGVWSRDNGVVYASSGVALTPVTAITAAGQYIPPPDTTPGVYTFGTADAGAHLLLSYSFIPAPLEEACIQMIAERMGYRGRIGEISKSLGGQETVTFMRGGGGRPWNRNSALPPEVMDLIHDYVNVVYPNIGAPL